jgi:hypothetical protein
MAFGGKSNPLFNTYGAASNGIGQEFRTPEQIMLQGLITEAIQNYGLDMFYVPRVLNNLENIYLQDDQSSYEDAYQIVCYVKNYEGFGGEGSLMSKFGLQLRDQITFTVSTMAWLGAVGKPTEFERPREGDLIYYPLNNKCFQIRHVENKPIHYPIGILPTWDLQCELFEYSNEKLTTGIPGIDRLWHERSTDVYDFVLVNEDGTAITTHLGAFLLVDDYDFDAISGIGNNEEFIDRSDDIVNWDAENPFNEPGNTGCPDTEND